MAETALSFFTVGHSSHPWSAFAALLQQYHIQVLVDTRSSPHSRFAPHFDRDALRENLPSLGVKYLWLGDRIGGRPSDPHCYDPDGRVLYSRVADLPAFREGIDRLERGARDFRIALLCAEEDPAHCHRRLLVSRVLIDHGAKIQHIRSDGSIDLEPDIVRKSGKALTDPQPSLFSEVEEEKWRSTGAIGKPAARSIFE